MEPIMASKLWSLMEPDPEVFALFITGPHKSVTMPINFTIFPDRK
jgi:hypothetical protein